MNWVFPIAGYGVRTSALGAYKPLIEVHRGYSIVKLCLMGLKSLIGVSGRLVFVASKPQEDEHGVSENLRKIMSELSLDNHIEVVTLKHTPPGQAHTVKQGLEAINPDFLKDGTFVINSDQVVFFDMDNINLNKCGVGLYFNDRPTSCFFGLDMNSKIITEIREKEKISCYASAGVFYFSSGEKILECIEWGESQQKHHNGELYLGPCMGLFDELSYFQTMVKFDLGNIHQIELMRNFSQHLIQNWSIK